MPQPPTCGTRYRVWLLADTFVHDPAMFPSVPRHPMRSCAFAVLRDTPTYTMWYAFSAPDLRLRLHTAHARAVFTDGCPSQANVEEPKQPACTPTLACTNMIRTFFGSSRQFIFTRLDLDHIMILSKCPNAMDIIRGTRYVHGPAPWVSRLFGTIHSRAGIYIYKPVYI